ncbi:MAG: CinA family nicotinamide mononucleotide deamidase-related protein [Phycisphaerales bacterium]|nr:CinA family nicotinamide mononucleotide deamidase-related protein [Phycisphaerales bacterium]
MAAILAIGDELMFGDRIDTNGPWLSRELALRGMATTERRACGDDVQAIASAIRSMAEHADLLVITGGLGPTEDDRTREALALAMGEDLLEDADALASIERWFADRGHAMPVANRSQAMRPSGASWLANACGTAPGILATFPGKPVRGRGRGCRVAAFPGPPLELHAMFAGVAAELLEGLAVSSPLASVEVHSWGLPESRAGALIADLMRGGEARVGILMSDAVISARITARDSEGTAAEIERRWSPWAYGRGDATLSGAVCELLAGGGHMLVTAESCTAGMLAGDLVSHSGASSVFAGGWVTYSNARKIADLGVAEAVLDEFGAVSGQTAEAMARGAADRGGVDAAISITGIAGPEGGSGDKPVGTVFIGCLLGGEVQVRRFCFTGTRSQVRSRSARSALQMMRFVLLGRQEVPLCWQCGEDIGP